MTEISRSPNSKHNADNNLILAQILELNFVFDGLEDIVRKGRGEMLTSIICFFSYNVFLSPLYQSP